MIADRLKVSACCSHEHEDDSAAVALALSTPCSSRANANPPSPTTVDGPRIERAIREVLLAIGEDPDREGLQDTPARVARAYAQVFGGLHESPAKHLSRVFANEGAGEVVICRNIEFHSMCEHHLLPFWGRAHVAYLPNEHEIVGLSKLARTVDVFARRPQVQERLTGQIADALDQHLTPRGVLVVIESEHLCMKMRGVSKQGATMVTTAARGIYTAPGPQRAEVMSLLMQPARTG